ncbi:MAG: FecR domain-containing protein, partial [Alphaproteobacteria bacterium]|nr:FecR domain-containing protein [Alphaproteobacteria bacterium]
MARADNFDISSADGKAQTITVSSNGTAQVPGAEFISHAEILRDGQDLILQAPDGSTVIIADYFAMEPAPMITAPNGAVLTPELVQSFVQSAHAQYANIDQASDASPVGAVQEVKGEATVTRTDGSTEKIVVGTAIFEGDIVETDASGAVNIVFIDETSFAVSEDARLAIDEYVFDPGSESGTSNFSVLRGVFVYSSGLIGRDDPDDVEIQTPVGSIGIRGTTLGGNATTGEITVFEGAIVLRGPG